MVEQVRRPSISLRDFVLPPLFPLLASFVVMIGVDTINFPTAAEFQSIGMPWFIGLFTLAIVPAWLAGQVPSKAMPASFRKYLRNSLSSILLYVSLFIPTGIILDWRYAEAGSNMIETSNFTFGATDIAMGLVIILGLTTNLMSLVASPSVEGRM